MSSSQGEASPWMLWGIGTGLILSVLDSAILIIKKKKNKNKNKKKQNTYLQNLSDPSQEISEN